ncbi:MAG TPA: exopolysaccharide biosynthesis protein [Thermoanaerobaculia bacterium]|nr:exopolysaccharide biosynthesis protein [Thermoanaerobaculia bacterium]
MSFHPFRSMTGRLRDSIGAEETLSLGELLKRSGVEAIGPAILVLAILSMVPYAGILTGVGLMLVGLGMIFGSRALWLPGWLLKFRMRGRHVHASLGSLERLLRWLGPRRSGGGTAWAVNGRFVGALVLWTAFVLALPMPLPFNNILPAVGLILLGLAVVERRPSLVGLGALCSVAGTAYFVLMGHAAFAAVGNLL